MINTTHKTIKYVNAGHGNQFLLGSTQKSNVQLGSTTRPLGIQEGTKFAPVTIKYKPGDLLFLYTDGVTDATNEKGSQFGEERLFSFLEKNRGRGSNEIVNELMANVLDFQGHSEQFDDLTVLAVKF